MVIKTTVWETTQDETVTFHEVPEHTWSHLRAFVENGSLTDPSLRTKLAGYADKLSLDWDREDDRQAAATLLVRDAYPNYTGDGQLTTSMQ